MASNDPERREEEAGDTAAGEDEDTGAQIAPIVRLEEVTVTTGEEDEDVLLDLKAKLYRYDKEGSQWKERGSGSVKILKHKENAKTRLVMRQGKTLKICANHLIGPSIKMQEHPGNEKSCIWKASDFSDGELKDETFCIRFASLENCKLFKEMVEKITAEASGALGKKEEKENKEVDAAAGELEKLSVAKGNGEEKAVKEETAKSDSDVKEKEEKAETKVE